MIDISKFKYLGNEHQFQLNGLPNELKICRDLNHVRVTRTNLDKSKTVYCSTCKLKYYKDDSD